MALSVGQIALLKFIRAHNTTTEPDEDILQDAMLTAYIEVERGRYQPRDGVPFTAYVNGIARNKLREARRRGRVWLTLEDGETEPSPDAGLSARSRPPLNAASKT